MSLPPTSYDYFQSNEISAGLSANQTYFTLNNKNITLYSGALHYFRVPSEYWRDRLRKMRAAGLNSVETYVPWNLHEPEPGVYDFGQGGTDFQDFLDIEKFLKIAQEEDLFAIVRPGPYICSEWDFGGMPSWLLRERNMKLRTSDPLFMKHVERYFKTLLSLLSVLQFTKGGPIIAFQIENEYGNTKRESEPIDMGYMEELKELFLKNGIVELLFTSDTPLNGFAGAIPGVLYTANFQSKPVEELEALKKFQPDKPLMVMEYWTGWFDHWTEQHHTRSNDDFSNVLEQIFALKSSVNFYMFHGGTNWGFLNGANMLDKSTDNAGYLPDTSSYDYDAPLTEAGDYTDKYYSAKSLIAKFTTVQTCLPKMPKLKSRLAYKDVKITQYMDLAEVLRAVPDRVRSPRLMSMEELPINNKSGQQYGYVVYQKENVNIPPGSTLKVGGRVCDTLVVLINGVIKSKILETKDDLDGFGYWRSKDATLNLGDEEYKNATLELMVENWGRNNYGFLDQFDQRKGLWQGPVWINGEELSDWITVPLQFKKPWTNGLKSWKEFTGTTSGSGGPGLYKGTLHVTNLSDTFLDMRNWKKGIVVVNGFVLSRYLMIGPQQTAYLPAPLLRVGDNDIIIFEHFVPAESVKFSAEPIYFTV